MPALAVAESLRASGAEVSFLGARDRAEARLVPDAGYEIDFLDVRGLDRRNPLRALGAAALAVRAVPAAKRVLRDRGADVVMGGGGYVSGPAGVAAVRSRIPLVLTEADSHLGLANRLLARRAARVCLSFPLPGREGERYVVTGRPVPSAVLEADRERARERFGIGPADRYLLVFGGSQGARSINEAALAAFAEGGGEREFGVVHVTGHRDYPEAAKRVEAARPERYVLIEYEPSLADPLAACDLVLARAGGSIFEIAAAGRPAILVPYPHAAANHQETNAAWMAEAGAAEILRDDELTPEILLERANSILSYPARIVEMSKASRALARPDAARHIADEILAAAGGRS